MTRLAWSWSLTSPLTTSARPAVWTLTPGSSIAVRIIWARSSSVCSVTVTSNSRRPARVQTSSVVWPGALAFTITCCVPTGTTPAILPSPTATRVSPGASIVVERPDVSEIASIGWARTGAGAATASVAARARKTLRVSTAFVLPADLASTRERPVDGA